MAPLFHPASEGSVFAFVSIVAVVIVVFLAAVHHAYRTVPGGLVMTLKISLAVAGWLGLLSWLVASGLLPQFPLNGLPFFFGSILLASVAVALSPLGTRLAASVPLAALVGFQAFRLPLELVLHEWAAQGTFFFGHWAGASPGHGLPPIPACHRLASAAAALLTPPHPALLALAFHASLGARSFSPTNLLTWP